MPAFLNLQKAIDTAYAQSVYGKSKRLTKDEKKKTEIVVHLEKGSTRFTADLWNAFNSALQEAVKNMTGEQTLIAILGVAAIAGSTWAFKAWLRQLSAEKEADTRIELNREETERYKIITELAKGNQVLASSREAIENSNTQLIKRLEDRDTVCLNGEELVNGLDGKQLVRKTPDEPVEIRLDGKYTILSVQSGSVKSGFKAAIQAADTGNRITPDIPEGTLSNDQIEALKEGEWEKKPVFMEINAQQHGDKLLKATLSKAGLRRNNE